MSQKPRPPMMPPVPRDHDEASFSEMVPFRSSRIKLGRSPLLLVALLTAVAVPFMFALLNPLLGGGTAQQAVSAMITMNIAVTFLLVMLFQIVIFFYSRTDRSIWTFMIPFAFVAALLAFPIISLPYFVVFRQILPGDIQPGQQYSFPVQFVKMFFGAGLMEELMKGTPILIGAWLTLRGRKDPAKATGGLYNYLHVRGPLDAIVMGVFAGGGFILMETAFQYVPNIVKQIAQQTNDAGMAMAGGLMLLLPRTLGGLTGHMAYAGIFGYFIGLAVIRPKQLWKLLGIGWLTAATIHALWNSVSVISPLLSYGVTIVAAVVLVGAMLKAREMEGRQLGRANESFGSIVVERPAPQMAPSPMPYAPPQPTPGYAAQPYGAPPQPAAPAMPFAPPPQPSPAFGAAPTLAAGAAPGAAEALVLDIDGLAIPLRAGGLLDLGAEPALGGRGHGIMAAVVPHPTRANVLGLRNTGAAPWSARLRDGSEQVIERDQNIRLAPGVSINFGPLNGRVIAA